MKRSGSADLPLHSGRVPAWLHERMSQLGGAIAECIVTEYGQSELLRRISDPFWFQSLGAVLGMDWHSSGITTSVMGALKKSINQRSKHLGLYVCGGRGKHSRQTPRELLQLADEIGLHGDELVRCSRLTAKIDNTAIQDGFQIYLHSFVVSSEGHWSVVQQGMNPTLGYARRYHWHSPSLQSFVSDPHTSIYGSNQGEILNMVDHRAGKARQSTLEIIDEKPALILKEAMHLKMPAHHDVRVSDIDLKRLGAILYATQEANIPDFETLLLQEGLGPRTLQSLALVSEIIYGAPIRFTDPARYAFAHGGKDGHPFPVPLETYDETISFLNETVRRAKLNQSDRNQAFRKLSNMARQLEDDFEPDPSKYEAVLQREKRLMQRLGGRTVDDKEPSIPKEARQKGTIQMNLFKS